MDLQQIKILVGLLAVLLFYRIMKNKNIRKKEAPQPAGAWPVIGHLHLLGGTLTLARALGAMADQYGPAFTIRLGLRRALVVSSWELAKECFTTNDLALASRPRYPNGEHLGYNYAMIGFTPYGSYWRQIRKIATLELLSNRRLESFKHVRVSEIDACVKELYGLSVANRGGPLILEMKKWFSDLTFNIVVRIVAGKRYFGSAGGHDEEAQRFRRTIHEFFYLAGVYVVSDALPFLKWLDLHGYESAMKKVARELELIVGSWVAEHREKKNSGKYVDDKDFIDVMLPLAGDMTLPSSTNPESVIVATCLAMILGGTDTTAVTLIWAVSLLLNNPHALKKAQEELDIHVGKERHVEESDVKNLVYLQAILKETLRLYTPAPLNVPHEAMEDCHVGGFFVPAGTRLLVNLWKLHRDPAIWSNPLEFQPERFLDKHVNVDVRGQHFECIPFGSGRRSCPGTSFALQVLHLTLARLIHGFEMSTPLGEPVDMTEGLGMTLPKANPLQVLITPRLPSMLYESL